MKRLDDGARAMSRFLFRQARRRIREAELDNVALPPVSLLPYKKKYQAVANGLPAGDADYSAQVC